MPTSRPRPTDDVQAGAVVIRILGIDPGSVVTGVGVIDADERRTAHVHHQPIRCGGGDFPQRLKTIFDELTAIIHEYRPDEMAVESVFVSRNAESALKLGQARGAAICAAVAMQLSVAEYAPSQVKKAIVGRGAADKKQVQHMVGMLLDLSTNLQADAADALGIALCHAHMRQTAALAATDVGGWR